MYNSIIMTILIFISLSAFAFGQEIEEIDVEEVYDVMGDTANTVLLDVRTEAAYNGPLSHITDSILIPLSELNERLSELDTYKEKRIIVICHSGISSRIATQILTKNGFDAVNMRGGMLAWNEKFITEEDVE